MLKINKLLFPLLFFCCTLVSAQSKLDSLRNIWEDDNQEVEARLDAMTRIIQRVYLYSNPDTAFQLAEIQYQFAEKHGSRKGMASALRSKALSAYVKDQYEESLDYNTQCLSIAEEIRDTLLIGRTITSIGNNYYQKGDYTGALKNYKLALDYAEASKEKGLINYSLGNVGVVYSILGNSAKALDYYQRSLDMGTEMGDKKAVALTLMNIASIYSEQEYYDKALENINRALNIYEERGNQRGIATSLIAIGVIQNKEGKYSESMENLERSLAISEDLGLKQLTARTLMTIGKNFNSQDNYSQALNYHQRSLSLFEEMDLKKGIADSQTNIGLIHSKLGNQSKALNYCQKSLELASELSIKDEKEACDCLYKAYKALGNGNKALEFHERILAIEDSLNAKETAKKLEQMQYEKQALADSLKVEEEKLEVKLAHQEEVSRKEKVRNAALGAGVLLLLVAIGLFSRNRYIRQAKSRIEKEKDRSENLLLNILPEEIAQELKEKGRADARDFDMVSILFTDFKGFTQASAKLSASDLVQEINTCFEAFDGIIEKYGIEKIKTIGDAYMAAGGLPVPSDDSVKKTVLAALEMQEFISARKLKMDAEGKPAFEMRVGIHTGPVVAGIVGVKKFQYDIWGDTVNTASRLESNGAVGKVNISQSTYNLLKDEPDLHFENRGKIEAKGKGEIGMWFVDKK